MSDALIRAEHLKVRYNAGKDNEFLALDDVSVEIFKEEYTIFFGPSGCGKSTLLYTILGLQQPSEGTIIINDRDSASFTKNEKNATLSQFFGIVFQNFNLIYSLNVLDNVALPQMFLKNAARRERRVKALSLLKRFGIDAKANLLPGTLSGGQQQRVAICRALINNPEVILADEPVGNLDSESAEVVMNTLKDINENDKKTIILVTHDPSYLRFADRVYFFKYGKIDRMVVNPKSGKTAPNHYTSDLDLTSSLEKLAHTHTNLTVDELKAWSLTNYLLEEFSTAQITRLEHAMETLIAGKMSEQDFYETLHKPFVEGGVGLYRPTALHYTLRIKELLRVIGEYKNVVGTAFSEDKKQVLTRSLAKFVVEQYQGTFTPEQQTKLEELVATRIGDKITAADLLAELIKPAEEGGLGLRPTTAGHLSDRLELVLTQSTK